MRPRSRGPSETARRVTVFKCQSPSPRTLPGPADSDSDATGQGPGGPGGTVQQGHSGGGHIDGHGCHGLGLESRARARSRQPLRPGAAATERLGHTVRDDTGNRDYCQWPGTVTWSHCQCRARPGHESPAPRAAPASPGPGCLPVSQGPQAPASHESESPAPPGPITDDDARLQPRPGR